MLTYSFENIGSESLYIHLYKCIRDDILAGTLAPRTRLPSKRSFAENLGVSVITVENAYAQLISEGYIYSLPKKGFYVSPLERAEAVHRAAHEAEPIDEKASAPEYFADFSSSRTDPANFPFATWAKLMRGIISSDSDALMHNPPCGGVPELRRAIAGHLRDFRGIDARPEQIIVGAGTEYLYGLLIQLLGFDQFYALEDPGYKKIAQIYESHRVKYGFVPLDGEGVELKALEQSGADILHISPSHHFPTGIVTPIARRYALLKWAAKREGRYIIEDDYDSEFRLAGKPIPALQSIDGAGRVIYMNTFSRSLASTIRISYMVLPTELAKRFFETLGFYACTVSTLEQFTLARFIAEGHFEKHINRMRNRYKLKRDRLLSEMEKSGLLSAADIFEKDAGLHFLLRVREAGAAGEIARFASERGVKLKSLSEYCQTAPPGADSSFVVSYSGIPDGRISEAVARLTEAVFQSRQKNP